MSVGGPRVLSAAAHYDALLAAHYSWMSGPFETKVAEQRSLFGSLGIAPSGRARALDLGSGPGFQSIALAELGFAVTAIDTSAVLLAELDARKGALSVETRVASIEDLRSVVVPGFALAVCMGDTLTHLESKDAVCRLFDDLARLLLPGGRLVLTFRELTAALGGLDRFIPVRSDADRVMTCFLEYEPEAVVVHDLVHVRDGASWTLNKSSYRKLRLSADWVAGELRARGFQVRRNEQKAGMRLLLAGL